MINLSEFPQQKSSLISTIWCLS